MTKFPLIVRKALNGKEFGVRAPLSRVHFTSNITTRGTGCPPNTRLCRMTFAEYFIFSDVDFVYSNSLVV